MDVQLENKQEEQAATSRSFNFVASHSHPGQPIHHGQKGQREVSFSNRSQEYA
jgi:hypothetical protein